MALQFNPAPILYRPVTGYERSQQIGDSLNNLGDSILNIARERRQQQMTNLQMQLLQGQIKAQQAEYSPLIPPGMGSGRAPTPATGDSSGSFNGLVGGSLASTIQPSSGSQFPSAPPSGNQTTGMPSSTVQAWNSLPPNHPFGPQGKQPSTMFQNAGASSDPEAPLRRILMDPNTSPALAARISQRLKMITEEEHTPFEKQGWQTGLDVQRSEAAKNYAEAQANGGVTSQDMQDVNAGNWSSIASRHNGVIPKNLASMGENADLRNASLYQSKLKNAQDALTQVRGDQSITRTEEQRDAAITAYNRIQELKTQGKVMNPVDYTDILGQIYRARTGQAPPETVMKEIRQSTLAGKFGEAYTMVTGNQAPATTAQIQDSLQELAASMGTQADKLHEGYMSPRMSKITMGLKPEDQKAILSGQRGLSFQQATGYQPIPTVNSQAEYDALPRGALYRDSTGKQARKK